MNLKKRYEQLSNPYPVPGSRVTKSEYFLKRNLRYLRDHLDTTPELLAYMMGIDANVYRTLESMDVHLISIPFELLDIIADYYGMRVSSLFFPEFCAEMDRAEDHSLHDHE